MQCSRELVESQRETRLVDRAFSRKEGGGEGSAEGRHLSSWSTAPEPSSRTGRLLAPPLLAPCRIWTWSLGGRCLHPRPPERQRQTPAGQRSKVNSCWESPPPQPRERKQASGKPPVQPLLASVCFRPPLQTADSWRQTAGRTG